jgi:hypothetical protein
MSHTFFMQQWGKHSLSAIGLGFLLDQRVNLSNAGSVAAHQRLVHLVRAEEPGRPVSSINKA